jgi:hypothetical protein
MTTEYQLFRVTSMHVDILSYPPNCYSHIADEFVHSHIWQQSIIASYKNVAFVHKESWFDCNIRFIASLPATTVDPYYYWSLSIPCTID